MSKVDATYQDAQKYVFKVAQSMFMFNASSSSVVTLILIMAHVNYTEAQNINPLDSKGNYYYYNEIVHVVQQNNKKLS